MTHRNVFALSLLAIGCALPMEDGPDDVALIAGGKADGSSYSECELAEMVAWVNGVATAYELVDAGVHTRAARNLIAHRDGADQLAATADDDLFDDANEVDAVPYVGVAAMNQLVFAVEERCSAPPQAEVIFSPQAYEASHLARIRTEIDGAERSIDIAMYSFRDAQLEAALARAVSRGVEVRMIFQGANDDRDPNTSASARLEALGIEVRWVNKIMHHKLAIIDGARTDVGEAEGALVISGSGNWSNSAATRYDENTIFVRNTELALRYQIEFDHLWNNGRAFTSASSPSSSPSLAIDPSAIADDPSVDAVFTSANFRVTQSARYGATFSIVSGRNTVADRWVAAIRGARRSIYIASGHLRSRPVAEALLEARRRDPALDIRIYLDGQEYLAASTHAEQVAQLEECLLAAGTSVSRRQGCTDTGFLYSYAMVEAGVALRYKYYAYRWDASYAAQMHHKYMIVDGETLIAGSYNLSDNAEHETMENISIFHADAHRALIDAFAASFDAMWTTGGGLYAPFLDRVQNGTGELPIVFDAMALSWEQVTSLKRAIRRACPAVDGEEYRTNPAAHRTCAR
jgi:phosphatidylserine/phosphatidylglycerophosphate/cardiolipin synthase-like enzyme